MEEVKNSKDFTNEEFIVFIKKAREIAGEDKIIGVNIMVALKDYTEIVKECVKQKIDLIISGTEIPKELPEYVNGFTTKIAPIVSSLK